MYIFLAKNGKIIDGLDAVQKIFGSCQRPKPHFPIIQPGAWPQYWLWCLKYSMANRLSFCCTVTLKSEEILVWGFVFRRTVGNCFFMFDSEHSPLAWRIIIMIINAEIRLYSPRHAQNLWNSFFRQNYMKSVLHCGARRWRDCLRH